MNTQEYLFEPIPCDKLDTLSREDFKILASRDAGYDLSASSIKYKAKGRAGKKEFTDGFIERAVHFIAFEVFWKLF